MPRQKTKARTSWTSKYDALRNALNDLLVEKGKQVNEVTPEENWQSLKNSSYEDYLQRRQDSEYLTEYYKNREAFDEYYKQKNIEQQEEGYKKDREQFKENWNEIADKYAVIPKYENTPFADQVKDLYDFLTNKLPQQDFNYSPDTRDIALAYFSPLGTYNVAKSKWGKDLWNKLGRLINDYQIQAFQGYIDRGYLLNNLVENEKHATMLEGRIQDITDMLVSDSYANLLDRARLRQERSQLEAELKSLQKDRDALDSYTPNVGESAFDAATKFLAPLTGLLTDNFIFGKTTRIGDEMGDILNGLRDYDRSASIEDRLKALNNVQQSYADKVKEWNEGIESNIADRESYDKVSDFFENKANNTPIEFFNINTYLYGLPGLIAGSVSSLNKTAASMVTGTLSQKALIGGIATFDPGAIAGGVAGIGQTYYLNRSASTDENNSEIAFAVSDKLKQSLMKKGLYENLIAEGRNKLQNSEDMSDDDVFDAYRRGMFTSSNKETEQENKLAHNYIENAFREDMAATNWNDIINTALEVIPMGDVIRWGKAPLMQAAKHSIRSNKYWRKAVTNPAVKKAIRNRYGQRVLSELETGFERGMTVGPVAAAVNAPIHLVLSPAEKWAGNALREQIAKGFTKTSKMLGMAPEEILSAAMKGKTTARYFTDLSGRVVTSAISEGIEEGKQGIVERKLKEGGYDSNTLKSVWDIALDDFAAGSKSAALILGMPFGLVPEEDKELLNEIKGGMLMGMFGPGTAVSVISGAKPYLEDMSANQFVVDNFLNKKFETIDRFNKGVLYAEKAKSGEAYNSVLQAFDTLKDINAQQQDKDGNTLVDPELIDQEITTFKRTAQEANNLYTIKAAESQGIKPNTPEYNQFVSLKVMAMNDINQDKQAYDEAQQNLEQGRQDILMKYAEESLSTMNAAMPGQQDVESTPLPESHRMGFDYADNLARYTALLKRKQQLEVGILNAQATDNSTNEKALKSELAHTDAQIAIHKAVLSQYNTGVDVDLNNLQDVEKSLVFDKETHDALVPLYSEQLRTASDLRLANEQLKRVTGTLQIKDGEEWRDITNDDYVNPEAEDNEGKFDPAKDVNKIRYNGGQALEMVKEMKQMVESDQLTQEDMADAYKDRIEKTAREIGEGAIDEEGRVLDQEKVNKIENGPQVEQEDPKEAFRKEIEPQVEQLQAEQEKRAQEASKLPVEAPAEQVQQPTPQVEQKPAEKKPSKEQIQTEKEKAEPKKKEETKSEWGASNKVVTRAEYDTLMEEWRKLHNRLNAGPFGTIQLGYIMGRMACFHIEAGVRKFAEFAKKMLEELGEDAKPHLKAAYMYAKMESGMEEFAKEMDSEEYVRNFNLDDIDSTNVSNPKQQEVVAKLKQKSLESQKYVIEVTPEYYLIKVGDEEVKMLRVHSVMPKSWVDDEDIDHKNNNAVVQASLQVGGAFDTLARIFFSDKQNLRRYENDKDALVAELLQQDVEKFKNKSDHKLNVTFGQLFSSTKAFEQTVKDLYLIGREYEKLEWELISDPIVWYNKFKRGYVAGETDMVAVDKDGNIHIIDFKTAKGNMPFQRFLWNRPELSKRFSDRLSELTKQDFMAGPRGRGISKRVRALKQDINKELGSNSAILTWNNEQNIAEVLYVNSNFYSTNGSMFRLRPKSQEYSDQLTAYAEMIQAQLMNVVDLEILGFRARYNIDYENIKASSVEELSNNVEGKPLRIKLSFSDEMRGVLNNEGPADAISENADKKETPENEKKSANSTEQAQIQKNDKNDPPVDGTTLAKPGEPELDKVNVKHKDHNGSLDHTDLDYVRISHDKQFTDDTNAYDFIDWCIQNGAVKLYTEVVKGERYLYADINYKGHEYKRVYIQTHKRNQLTPAGSQLLNQVLQLETTKKPGQKVVAFKMNRTAGQIGLLPGNKSVSVIDSGLFVEPNLSDVEVNSNNPVFGFVKNGDVFSFKDGNYTQQTVIYTFKGRNIPIPSNGTWIYIKSTNHGEKKVQQQIPVSLQKTPLSNDADFIIDCLRNVDQMDKPYVFTLNGQTIRIEATRKQLLSLLIPYANSIQDTDNILSIVRDQTNPSQFSITAKNRTQPVVTVNIMDPLSVDEFKKVLSQLSVTELHRTMGARLGDSSLNALPVFVNIRKFFANKNNTIKSITISPSLKFDFDDFKTVPSTRDPNVRNNGLSGFGWMLKNGWFTTQYGGMHASNVEIEDVALVDDKPIHVADETPIAAEEQIKQMDLDPDDMMDALGFSLDKRETQFDKNKRKLTKEEIKRNLRPILGNAVDDPTIFKIVEDIPYDPERPAAKVLGKASSSAITIYNAAFAGVEYHEAFHRIFELYVPAKTRNFVYKKVAHQLGINLEDSTEENDYYGHRVVAEHVADMYMDIKLNQWSNKFNFLKKYAFLGKVFNIIGDVARLLGHLNQFQLYSLFLQADWGSYKKSFPTLEAKKRFDTLFKELNYEIHGVEFEHILDDVMYEDVKDTAFYMLSLGQHIDLSGANVSEIQITPEVFKKGAERMKKFGFDILGEGEEKTPGQLAMSEIYDKFWAVSDDLAARFSQISTDYVKKFEEDEREKMDGDEESVKSANYEEQIRASYEFSRFDKTTSRVKFFFSLMPELKYTPEGKLQFVVNSLGMPRTIPMNYVFNEVLTNLYDVDTLKELTDRLSDLSLNNPMFNMILKNINNIISTRVENGKVNADKEALLAQLMTTIRSNRHTFMIARSEQEENYQVIDGEAVKMNKYNIVLETSDADYNAKFYPLEWSQILAKGGTDILKTDKFGRIVFNPNNKYAAQMFSRIAKFFDSMSKSGDNLEVGLKQMLSTQGLDGSGKYKMTVRVVDVENSTDDHIARKEIAITDLKNNAQCSIIKDKIVEALNNVGIRINSDEFEYMLLHKYGSSDYEALKQMVESVDEKDSMSSFIRFLNTISSGNKLNIDKEGHIAGMRGFGGRPVGFDNVYGEMAFVKELGNWKWAYRKAHDQLTVLALDGNRFYEMSDNDYVSDVLRGLNKRDKQFDELKQDTYNYNVGEEDALGGVQIDGSLTLKQLTEDSNKKLLLRHFIGFKTDKKGDQGQDYFEISRREDYLSKMTILENGGLIMLTLSDKKKYVYIDGVDLPGFNYSVLFGNDTEAKKEAFDKLSEKIILRPSVGLYKHQILQSDDIVEQMLSYARSEYESAKKACRKIAELEKAGTLDKSTVNYYTLRQGARMSSLLGVWENQYDNDGNITGEHFISFNDGRHDPEDDLRMADIHFFDLPVEEQKALIAKNLQKVADKELQTLVELNLISKEDKSNPYLGYTNNGLNSKVIDQIKQSYKTRYPKMSDEDAESLAVVMYVSDISAKAIISGQEVERLFSGNPAFYKWKYDKQGRLVDRTVDELKRLGGLGSTGTNNFTELEGIPAKYMKNGVFTGKYIQAEVDNETVGSNQIEEIRKAVYEGQLKYNAYLEADQKLTAEEELRYNDEVKQTKKDLRDDSTALRSALQQLYDEHLIRLQDAREQLANSIYEASVEEIETKHKDIVELSRIKANEVSEAYSEDIDVADGGAYVTDEMCEMMLRMVGSYSKEVEQAFDILRGRVKANYLEQQDAYQKVLTTVIGSQKYTAFGRRSEDGVSTPYYNKMALFPIFDCIATGKMKNIFDKMKQQGIDVLAVNSAVKLGSKGSKPVNWSDFRVDNDPTNEDNFVNGDVGSQNWKPVFEDSFSFDTYEQDFSYLRKQLNTDPTEEALMRMGTQMQKVAFSNMIPGKTYIGIDGNKRTGLEISNGIMNAMKRLSEIGLDKINKRFFKTNEDGQPVNDRGEVVDRNSSERILDKKKFADEVSKMMSERGADKNILKAIEYVRNTGTESVPLGAISNASWIESVLISVINKEVIDVTSPGAFFIQRSVWGMEGQQMLDRSKGQIKGATLYNGKELKMINDKGSMDCVLSLDFFEHILPKVPRRDDEGRIVYKVDENGQFILNKEGNRVPEMVDMSFEEAKRWLIDHNIIGDGATANIVAYRIPTQAESSIHALRCVDVLPVVRDTVILPKEFTKITGSDFDIDKLGLSWLNYNKQGTTEFEEGTAEYYQNELLKGYLTLLTDKDTQQILHRSIDNDTKLLKDILAEIEENSREREMPYYFYSLSTQTERKNDYITGKIGIGPFALNNNNHILTMLYGVKFKDIPGSIMSELGLTDLSKKEDEDHNSILSWISALINAHVDIAKDPYISRLNVNPFTYNLINTLIRTGFGKKTFYFTTQPIMKLLAKAYMNAQSAYMADPNKTQYTLQKEAITETAKSFFGEEELPFLKGVKFDDLNQHVYDNPGFSSAVSDAFKQIVDQNAFKYNANRDFDKTEGVRIQYGKDKIDLTPNQVQYVMYLGYLMMDPYAKSVSSLVKYSKIDTKKQGNNYIEQQLYKQGFEELFYGEDAGALFEPEPLKRMANESYIGAKTRAAIDVTADILKGHFLQATSGFNNARLMTLNMIGRSGSKDLRLNNKISSAISAAIKSQIINAYAEEMNADNPTYIRDLVNESFEENLSGHLKNSNNEMELSNDMKYKPSSYIGGQVTFKFVGISNDKVKTGTNLGNGVFVTLATDLGDGKTEYTFTCSILGANDDNNSIITNFQRAADTDVTVVRMTGGKNTIYDRFNRLRIELSDNPDYTDVLDNSGEPRNMLLRSLIPGRTYEYSTPTIMPSIFTESPDTYSNLKFLKLFNALDNNGVESNYIIDAWDQLLHDTKHPALQKFAEDLVIYAFVTSGDKGGFTKFFKQVPLSWRKESGYGAQIQDWINDLTVGDVSQEMLEDAILNNWFDNDFVRTYYLVDKDNKPQFVAYSGEVNNGYGVYNKTVSFPIILAAIKQEPTDKEGEFKFTPTIDPDGAPLFIKIPRKINPNTKEGQRKFSVYKLQDIAAHRAADGSWVKYPVYVKVNPKGVELKGGYLMTEYGRDDSIRDERTANIESLEGTYKVNDFISKQDLEQYHINFSEAYSQTIEDLNFGYLRNKLGKELDKKLAQFNNPVVQTEESQQEIEQTVQNTPNYYEGQIVPDANTIFVFGSNPEGRHGVGAAKVAREQFGAVYGQGEGLQGNSYAIPTKDLRIKENRSLRSISEKDIVKSISKMYDVARQHPDKQFKVAYRNGLRETTLNGYTGEELIGMFKSAGEIPQNVLFSKEWIDVWDNVPEDMYGEYTLAMNADDDYLYENMDEIYEYIETSRRSSKESRKLYDLTRKVKSAIKSRFVTFLNKNGVSMDDIIIGKQTESFKNGKYVSVKLKEYSEEKFNKLIDKIKELTDGNTTYSYVVDGDKILVKDSDYDKFDVIEAEHEEFIYDNVLNLYHMIQDEPSVEHAQSVLNGYSDMYSKDEIEEALGMYIKNFCERR